MLMIDIDRFKRPQRHLRPRRSATRSCGRSRGAIVGAVREDDVPARYGGEEFAVLLRNPTPEVALEVGERVRQAVAALDLRGSASPAVSVSVGVAVASDADEPIDSVIDAGGPGALSRQARRAATGSSPRLDARNARCGCWPLRAFAHARQVRSLSCSRPPTPRPPDRRAGPDRYHRAVPDPDLDRDDLATPAPPDHDDEPPADVLADERRT